MENCSPQIATHDTFRHYIFFWFGQLGSLLGSSIVNFALIWWVTIESRSATILSLASFLTLVPQIFISIFAGVFIDRWNRKRIIILMDFCQAFLTLILFVVFLLDLQSVWIVIGFIIFRSLFQSIHRPTVGAIIPVMIPKESRSRMNSINMIASNAIYTIGPIISGILIGFWKIQFILWADIVTFIFALIPTLLITIPSVVDSSRQKQEKIRFKKEIKEGYQVIMQTRGMFAFFMLAIIGNFFLSPSGVLRPYFINIFHEGSAQILSYLSATAQISMVLGSLLIASRKQWNNKSAIMLGCNFLIGFGFLITALAPKGNFLMIGIGLFVLTFGIPILNSLYLTILQNRIPLTKQGRVNALDEALSLSIMPISTLIAGPLAELIGINYLFLIFASIYLIITLGFAIFSDYLYVDKEIDVNSIEINPESKSII